MKISEIFTELRKNTNLSQKELATKLNISQSAVSLYERGERSPVAEILSLYADFFNVTVDFLIGREDDLGNIVSHNDFIHPERAKDEREVLDLFNRLDEYSKRSILIQMRALASTATAPQSEIIKK